MTRQLHALVELEGLAAAELVRLRRLDDLLVSAGPPLARSVPLLATAGARERDARALRRGRRRPALALAAAALALGFGAGQPVAVGVQRGGARVVRMVALEGGAGAEASFASLRVGAPDPGGNRPLELTVRGLRQAPGEHEGRYALMLVDDGRPSELCGLFRIGARGPTSVRFSVPYAIDGSTRWVVTELTPGHRLPGHVVMAPV